MISNILMFFLICVFALIGIYFVAATIVTALEKNSSNPELDKLKNYFGIRQMFVQVSHGEVVNTMAGGSHYRVIINTAGYVAMWKALPDGERDWVTANLNEVAGYEADGYCTYRPLHLFKYFFVGLLPNKKVVYMIIDAARWIKSPDTRGDKNLHEIIEHKPKTVSHLRLFPERSEVFPNSEIGAPALAIEVGLFIPALRLIRPKVAIFERNAGFYATISTALSQKTLELTRQISKEDALLASRNKGKLPLIDTGELEVLMNGVNFTGPIIKSGYLIKTDRKAGDKNGDPDAITFVGFDPSVKSQDYWDAEEKLLTEELNKKARKLQGEGEADYIRETGDARNEILDNRMEIATKLQGVTPDEAYKGTVRENVAAQVSSKDSDVATWVEGGAVDIKLTTKQ